ncbi:predicted protein [Sclerotinia sclerotiorum 1980 UF-70]|uniref:Uncharacterized protein n=1 Tax=Sclerotinia sclerotiorum (strain ATCC 18683 / 1980 / Ss-1) TaxID=665079 RepID=A7ES74_SCLS1|nr:predicted protein [Sclerotinia sclerotiorum 1980 UF-70]EDN92316.1 predicted protein [Sclerotinia sclerotiorum 1980 UF-70]
MTTGVKTLYAGRQRYIFMVKYGESAWMFS